MGASITDLAWFGAGLLVLTGISLVLQRVCGLRLGWQPLVAIIRACVQLAVIATVLSGVLSKPWTVALFLVLMFATASWTSAHRITDLHHGGRAAIAGVVTGASIAIILVFALRLMDWEVRYLIAVAGILIGNSMTAVTLTGRNFSRLVMDRRDQVEGWLALGATPSRAHRDIGAEAQTEALIPNIDQTRATGLVTLPGAFVGALMGGASPLLAAEFQLVVLAGVMLAMTLAGSVVTAIVGRSPFVPVGQGSRSPH